MTARAGIVLDLGLLRLRAGDAACLLSLEHADLEGSLAVEGPVFEIDGRPRGGWRFAGKGAERALPGGGFEAALRFDSLDDRGLALEVTARGFAGSPVLRLRYRLEAPAGAALTTSGGEGAPRYFRLAQPGLPDGVLNSGALCEYQLSHFDPFLHSYLPCRVDRASGEVLDGLEFAGPVALFHTAGQALLAAYEHGADAPGGFLGFSAACADGVRALEVRGIKGNYYAGQPANGFKSVWFELGLHPGGLESFLPLYRRFILEELCENPETRKPYLFYNTWNYQERQKYFRGRPFLESMHAGRMLEEIDAAHRLGIDVFVVDTGWYAKTGDWLPNREKFPEGLREIKRRLDDYGMQLGLWFNPIFAALTSRVYHEHPEWEMTRAGRPAWRGKVWETEESTGMCLASGYAEAYIETMVHLHAEVGVSYFKWDGVQQYGCDSPLHDHGGPANSPAERADCYAYAMGRAMIHIAESLSRRCPGAIVDFDITEGGRFVGLGFLSAGRYYLVNNGPYFSSLDIPPDVRIEPDTINALFWPGPARPRVCRTGARFDGLLPSVLFMTHHLTDGPRLSQANSAASVVLGGDGWWGDLPALSEEETAYIAGQMALYKRVAACAARAYPRTRGFAGSSPEVHEKISPEECCGLVACFTVAPGAVTHYTRPLNLANLGEVVGADAWGVAEGGRLKLTVTLGKDEARVVYLIGKGM